MTVPDDLVIAASSKKRVVVPLGMLEKGAKQRLDAKHDGKGIAVLGRAENSRLALSMLMDATRNLPQRGTVDDSADAAVFGFVVGAEANGAEDAVRAYDDWKASKLAMQRFTAGDRRRLLLIDLLVIRLAKNYLFLVEIDEDLVGIRTTLKYSVDQPLPELEDRGPHKIRFKYSIPDFGFAASQHVELEVPKGLCLESIEFVAFDQNQIAVQETGYGLTEPTRMAHAVLSPKSELHRGEAWVVAVPARQGVYSFSKWAAILTVMIVLGTYVIRLWDQQILRPEAIIPSPAASIILVTPALLLSWMSKEPEHELVARLLAPLRRVLLMCSGILLTIALLAAVPVSRSVWCMLWFVIYAATVGMALYAREVFVGYAKKSAAPGRVESTKGEPA